MSNQVSFTSVGYSFYFFFYFCSCLFLQVPSTDYLQLHFTTLASNNKAICLSGVLTFAVRKIDGKFLLFFSSAKSSVIPFLHDGASHPALFEGIRIRNSGNRVGKGLKLELCMLEPRRGSRLACDASRKVGQWATGSVNAFLCLRLFLWTCLHGV